MTIADCARRLAESEAFNRELIKLALSGQPGEALRYARAAAAKVLGRIPSRDEMVELCEASIALASGPKEN